MTICLSYSRIAWWSASWDSGSRKIEKWVPRRENTRWDYSVPGADKCMKCNILHMHEMGCKQWKDRFDVKVSGYNKMAWRGGELRRNWAMPEARYTEIMNRECTLWTNCREKREKMARSESETSENYKKVWGDRDGENEEGVFRRASMAKKAQVCCADIAQRDVEKSVFSTYRWIYIP